MAKKKEPTGTTVTKELKKTTQKSESTATPAVKPPVAEAAKPVPTPAAPAAAPTVKAAEKPAAPAKAEPAPAPAAKAAEKPAAPAKAEPAPAPAAKAAEKPAAPAKAEPVPAPAAKAEKPTAKAEKPTAKAEKSAAHPESSVTVIVAKYDVGHGNSLFIRGEGAGLSWDAGIQMENAGNDVWVWTTNETGQPPVSFKFLINDESWSIGDNMSAPVGETTTLYPAF